MLRIALDCSSITDFQQSTAISIAKKFRNLHIGHRLINQQEALVDEEFDGTAALVV